MQLSFTPPSTPDQWASLFIDCCDYGDFDAVKRLCGPQFRSIADPHYNHDQGFRWACENGHLDIVKFLSTSDELQASGHSLVDIHADDEHALRWSCHNGHLEIVQFLTTSPLLLSLTSPPDIHANDDQSFQWACENGHLEIVKFLTTSAELRRAGCDFANIHGFNDYPFELACRFGHLEIVRFLTTSLDLVASGHTLVDPHALNFHGITLCTLRRHAPLLRFFIQSPELQSLGIPPIPQVNLEALLHLACEEKHFELLPLLIFESPLNASSERVQHLAQSYPFLAPLLDCLSERRLLSQALPSLPLSAPSPQSRL